MSFWACFDTKCKQKICGKFDIIMNNILRRKGKNEIQVQSVPGINFP